MKKSIKKKWVAALRSGDYKQGRGRLRRHTPEGDVFCCLGVLCNLHAQAHPDIAAQQTDAYSYMGQTGYLPIAVREWSGLDSTNIRFDGLSSDLATINDLELKQVKRASKSVDCFISQDEKIVMKIGGNSFEHIANLIEEHL